MNRKTNKKILSKKRYDARVIFYRKSVAGLVVISLLFAFMGVTVFAEESYIPDSNDEIEQGTLPDSADIPEPDELENPVKSDESQAQIDPDISTPQLPPSDDADNAVQGPERRSVPKEIPVKITGMSITYNGNTIVPGSALNFKNGDTLVMNFNWAVDYSTGYIDINAGDYSSDIQLWPAGSLPISINYPIYGTLRVGGVTAGTMVLGENGADGKLNMAFNSSLAGQLNVKGIISVETAIKYTSSTETVEKIDFFNENFNFTFNFSRVPGGGRPVDKANLSYTGGFGNVERIHWRIDVNTQVSQRPDSNSVTDRLEPGNGSSVGNHSIDPESIKVYSLDIDLSDSSSTGGISVLKEVFSGFRYSVTHDGQSMTVTFDDLSAKAYRITYDTVPEQVLYDKNTRFQNTAALGSNSSTAFFELSPQWVWTDPGLSHKKTGTYNSPSGTNGPGISWSIDVNEFGSQLQGPFTVTETLAAGQELRADTAISVVLYRVNLPTNAAGSISYTRVGTLSTGNYTISDRTATGFKLTISDGALRDASGNHYMIRISFRAEVTDNQPSWRNNVSFSAGEPVSAAVNRPGSATGDITAPRIFKSAGRVDTNEKTIDWSVSLNPVAHSLKDVVITDTFGSNPGGLSMMLLNNSSYPFVVKLGSTTLNASTDYFINENGTTGFTVRFRDGLEVNNELLVLTFTTQYDMGPPNPSGQFNNGNPISFSNSVSAEAEINSRSSRGVTDESPPRVPIANHSASVTLNALQYRNAAKSGSYANGKFNWTINFNHVNTVDINTEVIITDRWGTDTNQQQIMDPASLTVSGADIVSGPTVNANGKGFTLVLGNIGNRPVEIKYNTYRTGTPVTQYYNYVTIGGGAEISAFVSSLWTTLLSKEVSLSSSNTLNWSVIVNQASYDLKNATVIDMLGKGQLLDVSSIVVYRCNVSGIPTGSPLIKGTDYFVNTLFNPVNDTTRLTINFNSGYFMNTPHMITYTSKVDDATIEKNPNGIYSVSNSVSLTGDKITAQTITVEKENHWTIVQGSGSGAKVPVYVEKRDAVTNALLAGAVFKLTDEGGKNDLLTGIISQSNGRIKVAELTVGKYRLYEVSPPVGYTVSNVDYIEFSVSLANSLQGLTITFTNVKIQEAVPEQPPPLPPVNPTDPTPPAPPADPTPPTTSTPPATDPTPPTITTPPATNPTPPAPITTPPSTTPPGLITIPVPPADNEPPSNTEPPSGRDPSPGANPATVPAQDIGTIIEDPDTPLTIQELFKRIKDDGLLVSIPDLLNIPLRAEPGVGYRAWALVNLILAITGALLAIITVIRILVRTSDDKDKYEDEYDLEKEQRTKYRLVWTLTTLIAGILGIIVFLLTEDIRLPMVLVDEWTIVNAIIFIAGIVGYAFAMKRDKDEDSDMVNVERTIEEHT